MGRLTYVDSGVLIAYWRGAEPSGSAARAALDGPGPLACSWLTRAEVLPKAIFHGHTDEAELYRDLLADMVEVPLTAVVLEHGFELACQYGLKLVDALHVACALAAGASVLLTGEKPGRDLFRASAAGLAVVSIWEPGQPDTVDS